MSGSYTEAQKRASQKYLKESVEEIKIRLPKGEKEKIKAYAEVNGESINQFVIRLIRAEMEANNKD